MTITELILNRRKQPFLIPIPCEDYVVSSVGVSHLKPCPKAAFGKMHACRVDVENKVQTLVSKPIREFNIFSATKTFVETADSQNV